MSSSGSDYRFIEAIGEGSQSSLRLAQVRNSQYCVAIKSLCKGLRNENLERRYREISVMSKASNPFVVSFYDTFEDADFVHVVMEFCEAGTLAELRATRLITEDLARVIITELACAIAHLHDHCSTIHRDIKPENILLDVYGHIRLGDFGFCDLTDSKTPLLRTACGSPAYVAPEVIMRQEYTDKADIWSFGVVMYFVLFGHLPFEGANVVECMRNIISRPLDIPSEAGDDARDLLTKVLEKDWHKRYSADEVLQHPWIRNGRLYDKIMAVSAPRETIFKNLLANGFAQESGVAHDSVVYKIERDRAITEHLRRELGSLRTALKSLLPLHTKMAMVHRPWHTIFGVKTPAHMETTVTQQPKPQIRCAMVNVRRLGAVSHHRRLANVMTLPRFYRSSGAAHEAVPLLKPKCDL